MTWFHWILVIIILLVGACLRAHFYRYLSRLMRKY